MTPEDATQEGTAAPTSAGTASAELARLADEAWDGALAANPIGATSIGDRRFDDRLEDISPGAVAAERRRLADLLERIRSVPDDALDGRDAVTREALLAFVRMDLDVREADLGRWAVDPLEGPQVLFLNVASFQPLETPDDGDRLLARWAAMDGFIEQRASDVREAAADGFVSAEAPLRKVIDELDDLLGDSAGSAALLGPTSAPRPAWSPAERTRFDAALATVVEERILPAFTRYRRALVDEILPRARRNDRLAVVEATFDPLPVSVEVARAWGRLAAAVAQRGGKPRRRQLDLAIAATATVEQVPLLTFNLADFRIIDDLVDARLP